MRRKKNGHTKESSHSSSYSPCKNLHSSSSSLKSKTFHSSSSSKPNFKEKKGNINVLNA